MLVLAAVPGSQLTKLRAAASDYTFIGVSDWGAALEAIRARPVEIVVIDPLLWGTGRIHEVERLRVLFPSLPLLVYTTLAPETAGVLLALGRIGIRRALFARFDDAPSVLRGALREELEHTAAQQVLHTLADRWHGLPEQLRWALRTALHDPTDTPTVAVLAQRAQLGRRTCERWFAKTGLPSPKIVLTVARLLYAHRLLLDPGYTVEDVALKLGYTKAKSLQQNLREVFGLTAGEIRLSLSPEEALKIVTAKYFPRSERAAS